VFHVQTEDSGVLSPHLFTHLFHGGVIVSTRKLVYDAGANEEAIKALMQAQHKAVMKDLRKGNFDDKIDQYLGGTPGLEPRDGASTAATPTPDPERLTPTPELLPPTPESPERLTAPEPAAAAPPHPAAPVVAPSPVEPRIPTPPNVVFKTPRTATGDRVRTNVMPPLVPPLAPPLPPPILDDAPTLVGSSAHQIASAIQAASAVTQPIEIQSRKPPPAQPSPVIGGTPSPRRSLPEDFRLDSSPEIQILDDEESDRDRVPRDTDFEMPVDPTVPTAIPEPIRRQDSASMSTRRNPTGERPASHVGATLPPARPPQRPAFTPPQVIARPIAPQDGRPRDSDTIEVHAPAPSSADPPPGERTERPGQYSVNRANKASDQAPMREQTGRIPAVRTISDRPSTPTPVRPQPVVPPQVPTRGQQGARPAVPQQQRNPPQTPTTGPGVAPKVPGRSPPGAAQPGRPSPNNVVMTRPAVVVGAPPKPATQTRVRKAREDEGRGFGSGLISEKSLDEVILAYLSEDAEEK
jgi:hypothetical protein